MSQSVATVVSTGTRRHSEYRRERLPLPARRGGVGRGIATLPSLIAQPYIASSDPVRSFPWVRVKVGAHTTRLVHTTAHSQGCGVSRLLGGGYPEGVGGLSTSPSRPDVGSEPHNARSPHRLRSSLRDPLLPCCGSFLPTRCAAVNSLCAVRLRALPPLHPPARR